MIHTELLAVEATFTINRVGLVFMPDFPVPENDWKPSEETVTIQRPDGIMLETVARFNLSHFNIPNPAVSVDRRWRVTICILDRGKEDVPIGSKLLVRKELAAQLLETEV
jgi:hypothetical protein